jgi:integrase
MKLVQARKGDQAFEHIVPLSRQAVELLLEIRRGAGPMSSPEATPEILFPNRCDRRRPMSKNALGDLYGRAGLRGRHVPHGWRAAFSTIMNERHREDRGVIDLALAHAPKDKVEAAYNRAEHLERRAELLQEWADMLLSPPSA